MKINFSNYISSVLLTFLTFAAMAQQSTNPVYKNHSFNMFADSIVQGRFTAKALSATHMVSNYVSLANEYQSPAVAFKFSINGKDNEMITGKDHHFNCLSANGSCETPLIRFGQQYVDERKVPDNTYLKPNTELKIKVDMRPVLQAFENDGYYTNFKGDKIYKEDFKGLYVAGSAAPLNWDFVNLANNPNLRMKDADGDGIFETTLLLNNRADEKIIDHSWHLSKDISAFPQYDSEQPLANAIYNMTLEEMIKAIEPDSTFRTGAEWAGVWTRDVSYSIILSMAYLQPQVAKNSLLRKVKNGLIVQDTGTGGAYPVSTDRIIWAVAAWEVYKATGDEDWLKQSYEIIKKTAAQNRHVAYDSITGLVKGESSFLDWREQTYPKWMQPADIYESLCLGTNAAHYQANIVLANMAALLGKEREAATFKKYAAGIKSAINQHLWMADKGYYAQFMYGRNSKIISPRSEALGEALCVLFDIAEKDRQKDVIANTPVMEFGVPCIYPQVPNIPPYHNNGVWPFVQSYFALAAAKAGNEAVVMESIAAIYRPAALWLTNKENFVAANGDYSGTQINSSNMLWSLAGNLALVHKILFGIHINQNDLTFQPLVPKALAGKQSLTNFRYRKAVLDIYIEGYGNRITSFTLDGKAATAKVPADLKGKHTIHIYLEPKESVSDSINQVKHYVTLPAPVVKLQNGTLQWQAIDGAVEYQVINKGRKIATTKSVHHPVDNHHYGEYQVIAVDKNSIQSFASEPVLIPGKDGFTVEIERTGLRSNLPYKGFKGTGFVEVSTTTNTALQIPLTIEQDGVYLLDFRYANGNGPTNTDNKCAIRTLMADGQKIGTLVFPQRGTEEWSDWGWSNCIEAHFTKGKHELIVLLQPEDENMNGDINQAMLDEVRLVLKK